MKSTVSPRIHGTRAIRPTPAIALSRCAEAAEDGPVADALAKCLAVPRSWCDADHRRTLEPSLAFVSLWFFLISPFLIAVGNLSMATDLSEQAW